MGWQVLSADTRHPERTVDTELWSLRSKHFRVDAQSSLVRIDRKFPIEPQMFAKSRFSRPHTPNKRNLSQSQTLPVSSTVKITFSSSLLLSNDSKLPQLAKSIWHKQLYCPIKSFIDFWRRSGVFWFQLSTLCKTVWYLQLNFCKD